MSIFLRSLALLSCLLIAPALQSPAHASKTVAIHRTLYDAAKGTTPDGQGWVFFTTGGGQTKSAKSRATTFSTLGSLGYQGGYSLITPFLLNRTQGYTLDFDMQVVDEDHSRPNRAGVSLIVLGSDKKGIELGFWTDQIWAQSDKPLFLHAEGAPFATNVKVVHYALQIQGNAYRLSADGKQLLSGAVRDYTAFQGPINPYQTPDFLFLGDDTHSAEGKFRIAKITIDTAQALTASARRSKRRRA